MTTWVWSKVFDIVSIAILFSLARMFGNKMNVVLWYLCLFIFVFIFAYWSSSEESLCLLTKAAMKSVYLLTRAVMKSVYICSPEQQ